VVEVAVNVVLVMRGGVAVSAHERSSAPQELASSVADSVRSTGPGPAVVIDAPAQVPGAEVLAALISAALPGTGVVISGDRQLGWAAAALVARGPSETVHERGATRRWPATVSAVGLTLVALVAGVVLATAHRPAQPAQPPLTALVEGVVTLQVPADWSVRRITTGPGSARVQVISPADPDAVVHITQSRLVSSDLAATAVALRKAVDAEPPGTFVDFNPADSRAGRTVVSYREIRPGRDIVWTVLVDGDVRISIGCQNAAGRSIAVAAACDDAVRTAQRLR
jgi:type VII secretion-associated protein (TIGR03931 family)